MKEIRCLMITKKVRAQKEDERLPAKLDSLKAYIALLSKFPLLSLQEEREITRLVYKDQEPGCR